MKTTGAPTTGMNPEHQRVLTDPAAAEWLRRFDRATAGLPEDEAVDLRADILDHLAAMSADDPGGMAVAVARLGEPEAVAAEAAFPAGAAAGPGVGVAAPPWQPPVREAARRGLGGLEIAALLLTLLGGIVVPVLGWIAGVILLWRSPQWTPREKLAGTLLLPGGLGGAALYLAAASLSVGYAQTCSSSGAAGQAPSTTCTGGEAGWVPGLFIGLGIALVAVPIVTTIVLGRRAQRRGDRAAPEADRPV